VTLFGRLWQSITMDSSGLTLIQTALSRLENQHNGLRRWPGSSDSIIISGGDDPRNLLDDIPLISSPVTALIEPGQSINTKFLA